ncbi:RHS repeat-associated core domain-containing protein [Flavobacterium sp. GT3R68]|uniref:RHS repeat-associated core domain-containing protein n=1 Tax=Flavobacterium sp. GT3R68 TaxID=2594437 RepID=UPI0021077521|nr:RHS repeat-associated core domain-containing protein [Flavobacterium sp. GT3R68]
MDYYPFGMLVPGRHATNISNGYRYGFQGQEQDNELKGEGNSLDYTFRMHDPRIGRFFAVDPLAREYAYLSSYQFASNSPIALVEIEGCEGGYNSMTAEDLDLSPEQIWNKAADGFGTILSTIGEYEVTDEVEGRVIYKMLMTSNIYRDVVVPDEVSFTDLGKNFKIRKENRSWVVLPEEGVLADLKDLAISSLDVASLFPAKGGVYMAIKTGVTTNSAVSSILKSLKVSSRSKEILETFRDVGGQGVFRQIEAEGMAIFEETFNTTVRAIRNGEQKAGDFIITQGKLAGKSVDLVSAVDKKGFKLDAFIKSIDSHFLKDGVDFINIDIRKLGNDAKQVVKKHIGESSKANQARTIITE